LFEGKVRREHDGAALVTVGNDVEEQLGAVCRERHEAQFVQDEQAHLLQLGSEPAEHPLAPRLDERLDELRDGEEAHRVLPLAGFDRDRRRKVRLARTARSHEEDVLSLGYELARGEPVHRKRVDARHRREVEVRERLPGGELRLAHPLGKAPRLPVRDLERAQPKQIRLVRGIPLRGVLGRPLIFPQDARKTKFPEVRFQLHAFGRLHLAPPARSRPYSPRGGRSTAGAFRPSGSFQTEHKLRGRSSASFSMTSRMSAGSLRPSARALRKAAVSRSGPKSTESLSTATNLRSPTPVPSSTS